MDPLEVEIAALKQLAIHDLRIAWRRVHGGEPPARLTRDLMARAIAYRMQERAHGGLAPATKRRLRALAREIETRGGSRRRTTARHPPRPGMGRCATHTVIVLEDEFEHAGERYASLTQIARRITGAHWSGPRFFRVRQRTPRRTVAAESRRV